MASSFFPLSVCRLPQHSREISYRIWIFESAKEQLGPRLRKAGFHSMNGIFFVHWFAAVLVHLWLTSCTKSLTSNTNLSSFRCMIYMYYTVFYFVCIVVYIWNYMFNIPYIIYHPSEPYRNPIAFAASAPRATWFWRNLFSINYKVQVYVRPFGRGWVETPTAVPSYDGFLVSGSTFGRKSLLHEPFWIEHICKKRVRVLKSISILLKFVHCHSGY